MQWKRNFYNVKKSRTVICLLFQCLIFKPEFLQIVAWKGLPKNYYLVEVLILLFSAS